jgi:hypothetical protein
VGRKLARIMEKSIAGEPDNSGIVISPKSPVYNLDDVRPDIGWDELVGCVVIHHAKNRTLWSRIFHNSKGEKFW